MHARTDPSLGVSGRICVRLVRYLACARLNGDLQDLFLGKIEDDG